MGGMLSGFIISGILTFGFVKPDMSMDPILKVYGVVNVCITFDYSPAREIFAVLWVFVCSLIMLHAALFVQRLHMYFESGSSIVRASYWVALLYTVMTSSMAVSMVIQPSVSVEGHTIPYQILIVGTCIWWLFNAVVIQAWPNELAGRVKRFWWGATGVFVLLSTLKIYFQWVLMVSHRQNWSDDQVEVYLPWWFPSSLIDPLWMLLLIFYRHWHPLSGKSVLLQFSNCNAADEVGAASICCFHIVGAGHEKEDGKYALLAEVKA